MVEHSGKGAGGHRVERPSECRTSALPGGSGWVKVRRRYISPPAVPGMDTRPVLEVPVVIAALLLPTAQNDTSPTAGSMRATATAAPRVLPSSRWISWTMSSGGAARARVEGVDGGLGRGACQGAVAEAVAQHHQQRPVPTCREPGRLGTGCDAVPASGPPVSALVLSADGPGHSAGRLRGRSVRRCGPAGDGAGPEPGRQHRPLSRQGVEVEGVGEPGDHSQTDVQGSGGGAAVAQRGGGVRDARPAGHGEELDTGMLGGPHNA
ncbi:hypothetical protein GCM10018987_53980 [Streptomyces cremeus]